LIGLKIETKVRNNNSNIEIPEMEEIKKPNDYINKLEKYKKISFIVFLMIIIITTYFLYHSFGKNKENIIKGINKEEYKILVVSDRDSFSFNKKNKIWESSLKSGLLKRLENGKYEIKWKNSVKIIIKKENTIRKVCRRKKRFRTF
jgi:hypothetical protein